MKYALIVLAALVAAYVVFALIVRPSNDRKWTADQSRLATAEIHGPLVTIHNVRNFRYRSTHDATPAWYDKTYDLRKLESVWFLVEPFRGEFKGAAHTFVSFGFGGGDFVGISVEIRKEEGESYSALKGLFRRYELMYVIGDERDLIKLRAVDRNDTCYLFPIKTTHERMQKMFISMVQRANKLAQEPEFYNTLTNTCTTNVVRHANEIAPGRIPFRAAILMPGYADRYAYDLGLIDTNLSFEQARERFRINEKARLYADDPQFSVKIRE